MQAVTITQITPPELETLIESALKKVLKHQPDEKPSLAADQLLTIQQVADFLSLAVPTIYGLVSRSAIPCMKVGKRLYFSKDEIAAWLKAGKKHTIAELDAEADAYLLKKKKGGKS